MEAFLEGLGNTAIIGAIVLVIAGLGSRAARNGRPAIRHAIWMTAFVVMIVAPLPHPVRAVVAPAEEGLWTRAGRSLRVGSNVVSRPTLDAPSSQLRADARSVAMGWLPTLTVIWIAGVLLLLARFISGINAARRMIRRATPDPDGEWQRVTDALARRMHIRRPVAVVFSSTASMPATWGTLRPVVVLPESAKTWDDASRQSVLLHELTHVARFDVLTQLLVEVACAILWFNPLMWWASARLRSEREKACDNNVVRLGVDRYRYADDLIRVAASTRSCGTPLVAAFSHTSEFESRVRALLAIKAEDTTVSSLRRFAWGAVLTMLVVAVIGMRPLSMARVQTQLVRIGNGYGTQVDYRADRAYTWSQGVPAGRWLEIFNPAGDVVITRAPDTVATVQVYGSGASRWRVVRGDSGDIQHCIVSTRSAAGCGLRRPDTASITRIVVALPPGVHLAVHASKGNIEVSGATDRVWARLDTGDIRIQTDGVGGARTGAGNVRVAMRGTRWSDVAEISASRGDVEVLVSPRVNAALRIDARSILSPFPLVQDPSDPHQARRGEVGLAPYGVLKVSAPGGSVRLGLLP